MSAGSVSSPKRTGCVEVSNALAIFGKFLLKKSALSSVLWNSTCQLGNNGTFLPWPSCPKPYTFNHLAVDFVVLAQVCDQRVRSIDSIDSIDVSCFTYVSCLFHFDGKMHLASLRPGQGRVSSRHLNLSPWAESLDPSSPVELGQVLEVHSCTWHLRTPHYSSLQAMLPCQVNNTMSSSDSQAVKSMGLKNDASVIGETYQSVMGDPNVIAVKPGFPISTTAVKPSNRQTVRPKSIRAKMIHTASMLLRGAPRPWIILGSLTQHPGVFSLPLVLLVNIDLTLFRKNTNALQSLWRTLSATLKEWHKGFFSFLGLSLKWGWMECSEKWILAEHTDISPWNKIEWFPGHIILWSAVVHRPAIQKFLNFQVRRCAKAAK